MSSRLRVEGRRAQSRTLSPMILPDLIKIGDATGSGKFIKTTKEKIKPEGLTKTRFVNAGDFLLTNSMSFGRPYILATDGCIHDGWLVLKALDRNLVDQDYFYHLLGSNEIFQRLASRASGSTVKNLNTEIVSSVEIPLPPLDEQRRTAAILDKADALRRKRRLALELLDDLVQSFFLEMFGSETNFIELETICSKITDGTHQAPKWASKGIPFLFVSNVRNQTISFETDKFVSEGEFLKLTKNTPIDVGDVLYTAVGSYGNSAVVNTSQKFVFQRHIAHLKPLPMRILPFYLSVALESPKIRAQADKVARGVAQKTVTLESLKKLIVPLPSVKRQQEFVRLAQLVRDNALDMRDSQFFLDTLFSSLQHRAFSGQL
jgi:type I restriction enzyme, S subunit